MTHPPIDSLAAQLRQDGIAFGDPAGPHYALRADLVRALDEAPGDGDAGVVVLDATPLHGAQLRDLAQDLQIETGLGTVLIRTPHLAIGVSENYTRAEIEQAQRAMVAEPDYGAGVAQFFTRAEAFAVPWGTVGLVVAVVVALIIAASALAFRRSSQVPNLDTAR